MGLTVYWTNFAKNKLKIIYDYHSQNVSSGIAKNIIRKIFVKIDILSDFPTIGAIEEHLNNWPQEFRSFVSTNYKIIYWINNQKSRIEIFDIFDVRQNPKKFSKRII